LCDLARACVMVGDTLHTDILARAQAFATALVTGYGSLTGLDVAVSIAQGWPVARISSFTTIVTLSSKERGSADQTPAG